ncbi:nucleotidyltransferase family protein [Pseudoalteromonas sp. C2R02]|nr:nucleotidyltransferase family protein [Pseudoalteromonas sp. C2R02]
MPNCYLAAGFVRNLVWDHFHHKRESSALNDLDVIYFDKHERDPTTYKNIESQLSYLMPEVNWQVRNQAIMHNKNGDKPYTNLLDAMSYWPEKETTVAIKKRNNKEFKCISAFGFDSLFDLKVTHNPKRSISSFNKRVASKACLERWKKLVIIKS